LINQPNDVNINEVSIDPMQNKDWQWPHKHLVTQR
jgi:hypothetical protein